MPLIRHWEAVIEPLVRASDARSVVEVGVAEGATTARLLALGAECGFVVHGVDPAPSDSLDLDMMLAESDGRFVFHRDLSLGVLGRIRDADVVILDGDHNWYTVFNELGTLSRVAAEEGRESPLTFLHDVDWPYGRRDLYYDPDSVPAEHRQPYARAGVVPWSGRLADEGGFGAGMAHATTEGGPRNGVRTALEDFLAGATGMHVQDVPGFHGVSIVVPVSRVEANPGLRAALEERRSSDWLAAQAQRVERARVRQLVMLRRARDGDASER